MGLDFRLIKTTQNMLEFGKTTRWLDNLKGYFQMGNKIKLNVWNKINKNNKKLIKKVKEFN